MSQAFSDPRSLRIVANFEKLDHVHRLQFIAYVEETTKDAALRDELSASLRELDKALTAMEWGRVAPPAGRSEAVNLSTHLPQSPKNRMIHHAI